MCTDRKRISVLLGDLTLRFIDGTVIEGDFLQENRSTQLIGKLLDKYPDLLYNKLFISIPVRTFLINVASKI